MADIGQGSIFSQVQKINDEMSERLRFKVDLQEELLRQENGEIYNKDGKERDKNEKQKRLTKEDIKIIIRKKMDKVKLEFTEEVGKV